MTFRPPSVGRRGRRGSNAVEFALIMPILVVLLGGIAEWSWYFSQQLAMLHAVREGARSGAATLQENGPTTAAENRVQAALTEAGLEGSAANVQVTLTGEYPDELIQVRARLDYNSLTGLVPVPARLGGELTMRLEDQVEP